MRACLHRASPHPHSRSCADADFPHRLSLGTCSTVLSCLSSYNTKVANPLTYNSPKAPYILCPAQSPCASLISLTATCTCTSHSTRMVLLLCCHLSDLSACLAGSLQVHSYVSNSVVLDLDSVYMRLMDCCPYVMLHPRLSKLSFGFRWSVQSSDPYSHLERHSG